MLFNMNPPEDAEDYIHRAGRTGRAGATGIALSLVSEAETLALDQIAKRYDVKFEQRSVPTDADVAAVVTERVTALLEARFRERDALKVERSQRFKTLARSLSENTDEAELIAMLLDDYYQQSLHAPPEEPPSRTRRSDDRPSVKSGRGRRRKTRRTGSR